MHVHIALNLKMNVSYKPETLKIMVGVRQAMKSLDSCLELVYSADLSGTLPSCIHKAHQRSEVAHTPLLLGVEVCRAGDSLVYSAYLDTHTAVIF